jgi:hypothetical protein
MIESVRATAGARASLRRVDTPDGPHRPADAPEPTARPDADECAKDPGDTEDPGTATDPGKAMNRGEAKDPGDARDQSNARGPGDGTDPAEATTIVPADRTAPPTETGVPTTGATGTGLPAAGLPPVGVPTTGATETAPPTPGPQPVPPTGSDAPHYPGQRYPAVPGREGEPAIPGEQPWGPPPPHATAHGWAPPAAAEPREQHTRRWIAGLTVVIVLALAAIGGGAWFLVTALSGPTVPAGYRPVDTPYLTYAVPGDWTPLDDVAARGLGVAFTGGADAPGYLCRGDPYKRGTATSALVQAPDDPATLARRFAAEFGRSFYTSTAGRGPRVALSEPRTVEIGDATGVVVEAVSTTPVDDGCLATSGRTLVLAVPVPAGGTAVLVANADTVGGPPTPPLVPQATVEDIVATAAVPAR